MDVTGEYIILCFVYVFMLAHMISCWFYFYTIKYIIVIKSESKYLALLRLRSWHKRSGARGSVDVTSVTVGFICVTVHYTHCYITQQYRRRQCPIQTTTMSPCLDVLHTSPLCLHTPQRQNCVIENTAGFSMTQSYW